MASPPVLIVITGPTGIGKSEVAVNVARRLGTEVISADSRQIYRDLPVTTSAPTAEQLAAVRHHLVGDKTLSDYYSAFRFVQDALRILEGLFATHRTAVLCGGSMMYIDALCNGIDDIPTISQQVRDGVQAVYKYEGLDAVLKQLCFRDPEYYNTVDRKNTQRVMHALEVCLQSGKPYSFFRKGERRTPPFRVLKFVLTAPRDVIFDRINRRTLSMVEKGMVEEVRAVSEMRELNSMNTVGVKEILCYLDGECTLDEAVARIQKNTRVYAKKQLTWFARDPHAKWIDITAADPEESIMAAVRESGV